MLTYLYMMNTMPAAEHDCPVYSLCVHRMGI